MQTAMTVKRLMNFAYALQKKAWRVFRPRTRGVKVMLFNARGELALIRNSYGRSDLFVLPGGGVRVFEEPAAAAVREVREELGLAIAEPTFRSRHLSTAEGKRDEIYLFEALVDAAPQLDQLEVEEVLFVAIEALPTATSPATRRRVDEHLGRREPDGSW